MESADRAGWDGRYGLRGEIGFRGTHHGGIELGVQMGDFIWDCLYSVCVRAGLFVNNASVGEGATRREELGGGGW